MKSQQKKTPAKKPRQSKMLTKEQKEVLEEADTSSTTVKDFETDNTTIIDLGNYGAACDTISIGNLSDTLTFDNLNSSSVTTITLPSVSYGSGGVYTSTTGTSCYPNTWTTTGTGSYTLGNGIGISPSTVHIDSHGIDVKEGGDIKVDGKSLKEFMNKMEQRLAILVPDPKKLEKFEALKRAYEHYKTMESLCFDETKDEEKK